MSSEEKRLAILMRRRPPINVVVPRGFFPEGLKRLYETTHYTTVNITQIEIGEKFLVQAQPGQALDLILFPSYLVPSYLDRQALLPLAAREIDTENNLSPDFLDLPYDPGSHWVVPLTWRVMGFALDKEVQEKNPNLWLKGLLDQIPPEAFAVHRSEAELYALSQALTPNFGRFLAARDDQELSEDAILPLQPLLRATGFSEDEQALPAKGKAIQMSHLYFSKNLSSLSSFTYWLPPEGTHLSLIVGGLPTGGKNPEGGRAFLEFLLSPEAAHLLIEKQNWATTLRSLDNSPDLALEKKSSYIRQLPLARLQILSDRSVFHPTWRYLVKKGVPPPVAARDQ